MNELSSFEAQNAKLDKVFDDVIDGKADVSIAQAAASVMNAKTRRLEVEIKRAVKGQFVPALTERWKREHVGV